MTVIRKQRKIVDMVSTEVNPSNIWRKSSYSIGNGECVEVASAGNSVVVRDSADPAALLLRYPTGAWRTFLTNVKIGVFDPSR